MAIAKVTTDYSTRTKDLHIMQGVNPSKLSGITPSFGKISNYCAGVQKLVQRYTILLLTSIGSQPNYPNFGTDLVDTVMSSSLLLNKLEFVNIFNFANAGVVSFLRNYQRKVAAPLDEQLNTATLLDIVIKDGGISLKVQLVTMQNTPVDFIVPLPAK